MIRKALNSRRRRSAAVAAAVLAACGGGFEAAMRSDWLLEAVREALVDEVAQATGGSVSLAALRRGATRLSFEIEGLEIRDAGEADSDALLTVPRASIRLGWRTLLGGSPDIADLRIRNPVVRVTDDGNGSSNVLQPGTLAAVSGVTIRRFEIEDGAIVWNGQPYAMQFAGDGLEVLTTHDPETDSYGVEARLSDPQWGGEGRRPLVASTAYAKVVASRRQIEFQTIRLRGTEFSAEASGYLRNLVAPRLELSFRAAAQMPAVGALIDADLPDLQGTIRVEGDLEWDARNGVAAYRGDLSADNVSLPGLDARAAFESKMAGDGDSVELTAIEGTVLGGNLAGSVLIEQLWKAPRIESSLTLSGVALDDLTQSAGIGASPWSGLLGASVEASGPILEAGLTLDIDLEIQPSGGPTQLPLEGGGSVRYGIWDSSATVASLDLATPNATVSLSGSVDRRRLVELDIAASLESRQAVERILAALQPHATLPSILPDGQYSFRGRMTGSIGPEPEAVLAGDFSITDLTFEDARWDRLSVRGTLSAEGLEIRDGQLVDGSSHVNVRGVLPLRSDREIDLRISGQDVSAAKLLKTAGLAYPLDGTADIEASVSGTGEDPAAEVRIAVETPSLFGESFDHLGAQLLYSSGGIEIAGGALERGPSAMRLTGSFERDSGAFDIGVESTPWAIEDFAWSSILLPGVEGGLQFAFDASGEIGGPRLRSLRVDGDWEVRDVRKGDLALGQWAGGIHSSPDRRDIQFDWIANVFDGVIRGEASLHRAEPTSYGGEVEYRDIDVGKAARAFDVPSAAARGSLTGSAGFGGVIGVSDTFEMNGVIERADIQLGETDSRAFRISNVFPMRWAVRRGALRFDSMSLSAPGTDFEIDGTVALGGDRELDMGLDGTLNLELLQGVLPTVASSGAARIRVQARGTLDEPSLEGSVEILDGTLASAGVPLRLDEIRGTVTFEGGQGRIENLTAASGGGTLRLGGAMAYRDTGFEYRIEATAEDIRVDYPASVSSVVDGGVTLAGVGSTSILNGEILISRMSLAEGLSFSDLFASLERPEGAEAAAPVFQGMQVNVHIGAVSQLPVDTDLVRDVVADLDLDVTGTLAAPSMLGLINIAQGEIRMLGTHYRVNRGEIRFVNPLQAEPVLDVELETRIRDVDLALVLSGPAKSLNLSYRSDPPIPFHDLVDLIAIGKEPTIDPSIAPRRRIQQQSLVQTGADALLSQAISRPVSRRLQRFFGVSRLKVDPQIGGLEANPSARLSTEQQIAEDLTLIYSYDLSSAQQQAIRIEWNPDRRWSLVVTRDQNGLVGSDILYKLRMP